MTYLTHSPTETEAVGNALAQELLKNGQGDTQILLYGDLGVGKTAFTRGFCSALGIARVKSPTYTVVNEYRGKDAAVFHFDLYRLDGPEDLESIGYEDYLAQPGFKIFEWSERFLSHLPSSFVKVTIERTEHEGERRVLVETYL